MESESWFNHTVERMRKKAHLVAVVWKKRSWWYPGSVQNLKQLFPKNLVFFFLQLINWANDLTGAEGTGNWGCNLPWVKRIIASQHLVWATWAQLCPVPLSSQPPDLNPTEDLWDALDEQPPGLQRPHEAICVPLWTESNFF